MITALKAVWEPLEVCQLVGDELVQFPVQCLCSVFLVLHPV